MKMKKILSDIRTMAAVLMASATLAACSSDDNIIDEQPVQPKGQVYTMTVNATKGGDATTRALSLDNKTLNATWTTYEDVYVKKSDSNEWASGTLKPQTNGATAVLKGTFLISDLPIGSVLNLQFPREGERDYSGQKGTLADIAEKYDYATASVTVASKEMGEIKIEGTGPVRFESQQAIVKFTLIDKANNDTLRASQLTVSDGAHTYYVTPDFASDELYVALPDISSQTITLTASVGSRIYTYERADVTFTNGKYYAITVKMTDSTQQLPLTVEALTADTVEVYISGTLSAGMNYSVNGGKKELITTTTKIPVNVGDKVQFYGNGTSTKVSYAGTTVFIRGTAKTKVYGNIMSLLDETGYATKKDLPSDSGFGYLFDGNTGLTDASGLLLPATTLTNSCYMYMFNGCTSLTKAPELPATTLAFGCYGNMFSGCSALTEAPALPADTLANACYANMFAGCDALTEAPELPAKTLVQQCYMYMFYGCHFLNYVKCLATSGINENYSTYEWLKNVYPLGGSLEIDQSATSSWPTKSANGIPTNWIMYDPKVSHPLTQVMPGDWKNPRDWKKVIGSDGTIYNKKEDMATGVTPVAFILYFGSETGDDEYKHGLAIAWEDENGGAKMTFAEAKAAIEKKNETTPITGGKWVLLKSTPWSEIFVACGNLSADGNCGNMNKWIGEVGGQKFKLGDYYWSGSVHTDAINEDYIRIYNFAGEWTAFSTYSRLLNGEKYKVRAVLAF